MRGLVRAQSGGESLGGSPCAAETRETVYGGFGSASGGGSSIGFGGGSSVGVGGAIGVLGVFGGRMLGGFGFGGASGIFGPSAAGWGDFAMCGWDAKRTPSLARPGIITVPLRANRW